MFRSAGLRFLGVGVLVLLMVIPLNMVSSIINERARYSEATVASISREWGGPQIVSGPMLVIPVSEEVTYDRKREAVDPITGATLLDAKNNIIYERYQETKVEPRAPVYLFPGRFDVDVVTETQTRKRGLFDVPVFTAHLDMVFDFDPDLAETALRGEEDLQWNEAELRLSLSENRALRGEARLEVDGAEVPLEPLAAIGQSDRFGVVAGLGDPRALAAYDLTLTLNGAQRFALAAVGRTTRFSMESDWPDPSFSGSFLPDGSDISEDGFAARWSVPHLARSLPQVTRETPDEAARKGATMAVEFITPNDFYQKAWRSARYGILFIALTFLTILLLDRTSERPAHPVQYLMVGLAQSVFVLLMLSYAADRVWCRLCAVSRCDDCPFDGVRCDGLAAWAEDGCPDRDAGRCLRRSLSYPSERGLCAACGVYADLCCLGWHDDFDTQRGLARSGGCRCIAMVSQEGTCRDGVTGENIDCGAGFHCEMARITCRLG